jgi:hypothetical protein
MEWYVTIQPAKLCLLTVNSYNRWGVSGRPAGVLVSQARKLELQFGIQFRHAGHTILFRHDATRPRPDVVVRTKMRWSVYEFVG